MEYLTTNRFILREFTIDDEENLFQLNSDPEVMRWLTNGIATPRLEIKKRIKKSIELQSYYRHQFGMWAAIQKDTKDFIGWFHLRPCHKNRDNLKKVELGYRLFKRFWGQGYATEGSKALIYKAFNELEVEEVFATTMAKNLGSRRVMEKCGLQLSHVFYDERFPVKDELAVYYRLLNNSQS